MSANMSVGARFNMIAPPVPVSSTRSEAAPALPELVAFTSELQAGRGRGQIAVNGQVTLTTGPGLARATMPVRRGENRVEAWLSEPGSAGVWRFELLELVEPGSLAVQAGDVQVVTGDSVVFRLKGAAGERVAFTFRRRTRSREEER
jgi:hypothetical protein